MQIWGLHVVDLALVFLYVLVVLWLGKRAATKTTTLDEFFLAGEEQLRRDELRALGLPET